MVKRASYPSVDNIITFIRENPDHATKRDIARAFNIKGEGRIWLKDLLRRLGDEGKIEKRGKRHQQKDILPPVTLLDIFGRDGDGDLLARPAKYQGEQAPLVTVRPQGHKAGMVAGVGDRVLAKIFASKGSKGGMSYHARIIRKIDKPQQTALGILRRSERGEWRLQPVLRKSHEINVDAHSLNQAKEGDLVEVDVDDARGFGLKRGRLRQVIGQIASEKSLSLIALYAHSIAHIFPPEVLDEAAKIQPVSGKGREDWRHIDFVTIDPVDAKDHDDAVFAEPDRDPLNEGGYVVRVAIADVSAYVTSGSEMDREAERRGNSVYFPDRVVPMLPERISNDLGSLREGEDRPALGLRLVFDKKGNQRAHSFHRVMMRSRAKLDYEQVQKALYGLPDDKTAPLVETILQPLFAAYKLLKRARDKRMPLDLDLPERKILLDDAGRICDVIIPPRLDAHRLIEEMMIAANVAAAQTLALAAQPLIYRIHDQPPLARQEVLRTFLHSIGLPLARSGALTSARLNGLLAQAVGTQHHDLINQMVLRSQAQAQYSTDNIGHFGLALKNYTHFTSPIRRYADLIIHRALIKALKLGDDGLTASQEARLADIASAISSAERRAQAAERETVDRLIAHYLGDQTGGQFSARISGVTKSGLFVTLDKLGADGFIPISSLGRLPKNGSRFLDKKHAKNKELDQLPGSLIKTKTALGADYYHFDEASHALIGEHTRRGYQLADSVEVRLVEALPLAGALRFEMLTPPRSLLHSTLSYHKSSTGSKRSRPARARR